MKLLVVILVLISPIAFSDEVLPIRPRQSTPRLQPKKVVTSAEDAPGHSAPTDQTSLQMLIVSPLIEEKFPEKRFKAWGNALTASIPVFTLSDSATGHVEFGVGFTLIRLTLTQPATEFSHLYLFFPVQLRLLHAVSKSLLLEGTLGVLIRPFEYDSRSTTDGGFHSVASGKLSPNGGIGLNYLFSPNFFGRISLSYTHVGLGAGLFL